MRNAFQCAILRSLWISPPENSSCVIAQSLTLRTLPYTSAWIPRFSMSRIVRGHYLPAPG
jgi:hypothetical protein